MDFNRRRFIGAALATGAGLAVASCVKAPPKLSSSPPLTIPPVVVAPPPAQPLTLLDEAKAALDAHAGVIVHRDRIGLVDFSLRSASPRFHLLDLASGRIERSYLVAHGSGSDPDHTGMLHRFSNEPGSFATSRGAYVTADRYVGQHGSSLRLVGLDPDNDMALARAIVIHGAAYVDPALAVAQGRIGRSQGCFAFELAEVGRVMERLGEGRMIYAAKLA